MLKLQLYTDQRKVYANFDADKFLAVCQELRRHDEGAANKVLEHALSAATGNRLEDGEPLSHVYTLECLPRHGQTGETIPEQETAEEENEEKTAEANDE